jgi:lipoate-protein ligase B
LEGEVFIFPQPVPYEVAWELQSRFHAERLLGRRPDMVLILEHQPVYTLGRSTQESHWGGNEAALRVDGADLHRVNRGGSVTYHGPGQILLYPIVRLTQHATGPRQFVHLLEEVAIRLLRLWRIDGYRVEKKPGVWVMAPEPAKIASLGVRIERGITLHGLALNVDLDLTPFQRIHPCGFADCSITSMAALRKAALPVDIIKRDLARMFGAVFVTEWPTSIVESFPPPEAVPADETGHMRTSIV